jgi:hypothetical protein
MIVLRIGRNQLCPTPGHCETEPWLDLRVDSDDLERLHRHVSSHLATDGAYRSNEDYELQEVLADALRRYAAEKDRPRESRPPVEYDLSAHDRGHFYERRDQEADRG